MRKNNKMRIFKLILVGIILIFSSCDENSSNKDFFLGGEIINPSSKYVNFYYNNIKIDSIELDSENKFFKRGVILLIVSLIVLLFIKSFA